MRGSSLAAWMMAGLLAAGGAAAADPDPAIRNSIGIDLKLVPAGTFTMGDPKGDADELPHGVTLTTPFYLGCCEVTNGQWKTVMDKIPSHWQEASRPVERVAWEEAVEFCRRLSELPEERSAGRVYRLPTEAEWEYACRAGTTTRFAFGDDPATLGEHGWFADNAKRETQPVGGRKANAWGFFDMHGNVWEWCSDRYGIWSAEAATDPPGARGGAARVVRGGAWYLEGDKCRAAFRGRCHQARREDYLGLRVALDVPKPPEPQPPPEPAPEGTP